MLSGERPHRAQNHPGDSVAGQSRTPSPQRPAELQAYVHRFCVTWVNLSTLSNEIIVQKFYLYGTKKVSGGYAYGVVYEIMP